MAVKLQAEDAASGAVKEPAQFPDPDGEGEVIVLMCQHYFIELTQKEFRGMMARYEQYRRHQCHQAEGQEEGAI